MVPIRHSTRQETAAGREYFGGRISVADPILFAHEEIDPHDGIAADPKYAVPAFQVFYVARS